jgi:type IV secretory pathway VirB10-like protein
VWSQQPPQSPHQPGWNQPHRTGSDNLVGSQRTFWQRSSGTGVGQWLEARVTPPPSPYTVLSGTLIPVVLAQRVVSDVEGQLVALVSQDVYDTPAGRFLLVPQGSRLFGFYDADLHANQPRLHMAFRTLYFPDGSSLALGGAPAVNGLGVAGLTDQVNRHLLARYGPAVVLSAVTAGVSLSLYRGGGFFYASPEDALAYGAGQVLGRVTGEDLRRAMHIRPTLTIREGYPFAVQVMQDVVFPGPYPFQMAAQNGGRQP